MLLEVYDGFPSISMKSYIEGMLVGIEYLNDKATPSLFDLFELNTEPPKLSEPESHHFHRLVAQLLYLAKRVRPDDLVTTRFLCTRMKEPTVQDKQKLDRLLAYLQATKERKLLLRVGNGLQVTAYIDAAYGNHNPI